MLPAAKYPGASVFVVDLKRADEIGSIRVQDYGDTNKPGFRYKVGAFLPGEVQSSPGDTPKIWPEHSEHAATPEGALALAEVFLAEALRNGWQREKT